MGSSPEYVVCDDREDHGDELTADTRLDRIKWSVKTRTSGWRSRTTRVDNYRLSDNAVQSLKGEGLTTLADLRGYSESQLRELKGVGKKAAQRLVLAMEQADVWYQGIGYPHELTVTVQVPEDAVPIVKDYPRDEVEAVVRSEMEGRDFFANVGERIVERRIDDLEEKRQRLTDQIEKLKRDRHEED